MRAIQVSMPEDFARPKTPEQSPPPDARFSGSDESSALNPDNGKLESASVHHAGQPHTRPAPSIPDYQMLRCIGHGSYGEVWLACSVMGTYRAVKIVYRDSFDGERPYAREFAGIQKFEPISRLHESQVDVLHVGQGDGYFYYVMELADDAGAERDEGELESRSNGRPASTHNSTTSLLQNPASYAPKTLKSEIARRGHLPLDECLQIGLSLTTALEHLHEHGLVHRDIKPSNVIFAGGVTKLADIGLVTNLDATLSCVGTEGFIPPEGPGTPQADLYSLGKVLYEICTGKDRHDFPAMPAEWEGAQEESVLLEFHEVLLKACEPDGRKRYQTARGMRADLALLHAGKSVRRLHRTERRLQVATRLGAVLAVLALLATGGYFYQQRQTREIKRLAEAEALARGRAEDAYSQAAVALNQLEMQRAEQFFQADQATHALASLARLLRDNPTNGVAADRLLAALSQRSFAVPAVGPLKHRGLVFSAQFSPDGKQIITASEDKTARIWDALTGKLLQELQHTKPLVFARFSPHGDMVLSRSKESAWIWDARAGKLLTELRHSHYDYEVSCADFSPDGLRVVTGSREQGPTASTSAGRAQIWEARSGRPLGAQMRHDEGQIESVQFSPDGERVVTASSDKTARVWNARTGHALTSALPHGDAVVDAVFSPDGKTVATASWDWSARVWNSETGELLIETPKFGARIKSARFSPDGGRFVTAGGRMVRIWDARTGQLMTPPLQHEDWVQFAEFTSDRQRVVTRSGQYARLWEARTGQPLTEPLRPAWEPHMPGDFSPDGQRLVLPSGENSAVVWDIRTAQPRSGPRGGTSDPVPAQISPTGQQVVSCSNNAAWIWEARSGRKSVGPLQHDGLILLAEFSPDSHWVVTASDDATARIWNTQTGDLRTEPLSHQGPVVAAHFSPDGQQVVTASKDATARIWDARTGEPLTGRLLHEKAVTSCQFSPDGFLVVTASEDGMARIWNARTGLAFLGPLPHHGPVASAQFSSDGLKIVTTARDYGEVCVWDARRGQLLTKARRDQGTVPYAVFSPDGERVVSASWDRTARIWDARTGQPLTAPLRHEVEVVFAQFFPDGRRVVTGGVDGTVRVWDGQSGLVLSEAFGYVATRRSCQVSKDGQWLVTAHKDGTVFRWDILSAPLPVPAWLPELAEALAGERVRQMEIVEPAPSHSLFRLKQERQESSATSFYDRWAKWFFMERSMRPFSLSSSLTVPEYVSRRVQANTLPSLQEAVCLSPTNGLAFARLAIQVLGQDRTPNDQQFREANFYSRRAVDLSPNDPEVLTTRDVILGRIADAQKHGGDEAANRVVAGKP